MAGRKGWKGEGGRKETQKAKARSQWDRGRERQQRQGKETEGRKKETKRGGRRQTQRHYENETGRDTGKREWGEGDKKEETNVRGVEDYTRKGKAGREKKKRH